MLSNIFEWHYFDWLCWLIFELCLEPMQHKEPPLSLLVYLPHSCKVKPRLHYQTSLRRGTLHDDGIKEIDIDFINISILQEVNFWTRCTKIIFFIRQFFTEMRMTIIYCIQWPKHNSCVYPTPLVLSLSFLRIANGLAERSTCSTLLNSKNSDPWDIL